jgi:hypothetical protein
MWVSSWDEADEIEGPSHFRQQIVFTVFLNRTGVSKIAILPERRIMAVVTVHPFTTPKGFENIWQISDSKEWRIRPTVQIGHRITFVSLGRRKMRENFSRQHLDRHGDLSVAVGRFLRGPSACIL